MYFLFFDRKDSNFTELYFKKSCPLRLQVPSGNKKAILADNFLFGAADGTRSQCALTARRPKPMASVPVFAPLV